MARKHPPRDRETAPDDESGAESFARADQARGIVRLSDLVAAGEVSIGAAGRPPEGPRRRVAGISGDEAVPTGSAPRQPRLARDGVDTPSRVDGTASGGGRERTRQSQRADDADAASDDACDTTTPSARRGPARAAHHSRSPGREAAPDTLHTARRSGADAASNAVSSPSDDAATPPPVELDGPAYESLFGPAADTRRKPRRERKPATALQRALGLLTRREHSRKELTRKLVSRGVDAAEVEAAVDKLTNAGWQDDRRFAESLVRSRAASGYGPLHIRAELGTHDLPAEVRQLALDDFDGDWTGIARDLVARRFGRIDDARTRERKAADYLIRRGFPSDVVRAVVRFPTED